MNIEVNHDFNLYFYSVVLISDGSRRLSVAVDKTDINTCTVQPDKYYAFLPSR